jgi:hypothetical protein
MHNITNYKIEWAYVKYIYKMVDVKMVLWIAYSNQNFDIFKNYFKWPNKNYHTPLNNATNISVLVKLLLLYYFTYFG